MEKAPTTYRFVPDVATLEKMKDFYRPFQGANANPYIEIFVTSPTVSVSIYKPNKKGVVSVVFQGKDALKEAKIWDPSAKIEVKKESAPINRYPQIGSDEVGTGDFFGPVVVAAAYVRKEDLPLLTELGVTDSKKMSDEKILEVGKVLIQKLDYSELALPNAKYNTLYPTYNMNAIKAKMHNRCLSNLAARHPEAYRYQDQFVEPRLYYSYLQDEPNPLRNIVFHVRGEIHFPSVAAGSVIARYAFLKKMEAMNETYGMDFPLGAGQPVDDFLPKFIAKYGKEKLREVAKLNWANGKKFN